jgi:hypothetical protein
MGDARRIGRRASRPLALYQTTWAWLVTVVGTLGALTAYALRPIDQFVAIAVTGLSLGACAGCLFDLRDETVTVRSMAIFGAAGAVGLLALLGLGAVFGGPAVAGGVALVAICPWVTAPLWRLLTRKLGLDKGRTGKPAAPVTAPDLPACNMDDATLLKAWRASSVALCWVDSNGDWLSLAKRRQDYLNEHERRDPRGFASWMATTPDMDDDPASYFHRRSTPDTRNPGPGGGTDQK